METIEELLKLLEDAIKEDDFVKLTLSKTKQKDNDLKKVTIKPVELKAGKRISFQYQYQRRDEVKNYDPSQSISLIQALLKEHFFEANLFTLRHHYILMTSKKGSIKLIKNVLQKTLEVDSQHDKQKSRLIDAKKMHWYLLGLTDLNGTILPSMQHKFKQVNKYIEILDGLIEPLPKDKALHIADMGAGKGYLTFALYEYLLQRSDLTPFITGIEQRPDLVDKTNAFAKKAGYENLHFIVGSINDYKVKDVDILIALHACDTATDDAIAAGIKANAKLIVCAPCCHKQIRNEMKVTAYEIPILRYGILYERQAEILTDTLRAMIMEKYGYKSQIMEFIDAGHTPKNLLLTGIKTEKAPDIESIDKKIDELKKQYGIQTHYLETALNNL
ncbi:MAG: SAM-dependent methyltransferase [Bacteroidetes bacterium HGW-Bacteroidetes-1]|jgi:SAM-dependent methyltransferase|nr:MAG: SAM-dependent methyltransferase [Bacteroidetes bacterium HGW-Bacteroidetes-1]